MADFPSKAADVIFNTMAFGLRLNDVLKLPVISTARPFAFYRKVFFDGRSAVDVLESLQGKTVVDVGCGLTPYVEDSMFQECRRAGIAFYGIDPKLEAGFKLSPINKAVALATGARHMPRADVPGLDKAIATYADDMPFGDGEVDMILSSWLLFAWIQDEALLVRIFTEFDRVLAPGGTIAFFPSLHMDSMARRYPTLAALLQGYEARQRFLLGVGYSSLPATYVTHLRKALV